MPCSSWATTTARRAHRPQVRSRPLTGPQYDLTDTVKAYTAKISASKIILGVPYYGRAWSTTSDAANAANLDPARYGSSAAPTFADAMAQVELHGRRFDPVEQAPWTAYRKSTCAHDVRLRHVVARAVLRRRRLARAPVRPRQSVGPARGRDLGARLRRHATRASRRAGGQVPRRQDGPDRRDQHARPATARRGLPGRLGGLGRQRDRDLRRAGVRRRRRMGRLAHRRRRRPAAIYPGANGRTYAFRVRATDVHGNVSAWKAARPRQPPRAGVDHGRRVRQRGRRRSAHAHRAIDGRVGHGDALGRRCPAGDPRPGAAPRGMPGTRSPARSGNGHRSTRCRSAAGSRHRATARPTRSRAAPVYATVVHAGITGLVLAGGGARVVTPNGDGSQDTIRVQWTNNVASTAWRCASSARTARSPDPSPWAASAQGPMPSTGTAASTAASFHDGVYVLQIRGMRGSAAFVAPSAYPTTAANLGRYGVIVAGAAPTAVVAFASPASPTRAASLTWTITFGGGELRLLEGRHRPVRNGYRLRDRRAGRRRRELESQPDRLQLRHRDPRREGAQRGRRGARTWVRRRRSTRRPCASTDRARSQRLRSSRCAVGSPSGRPATNAALAAIVTWSATDPGRRRGPELRHRAEHRRGRLRHAGGRHDDDLAGDLADARPHLPLRGSRARQGGQRRRLGRRADDAVLPAAADLCGPGLEGRLGDRHDRRVLRRHDALRDGSRRERHATRSPAARSAG